MSQAANKKIRAWLSGIAACAVLPVFFANPAWAQEVQISARLTPQQAAVGQPLQLVVIISGKASINAQPQLPDLPAFQVSRGGRSSNFSFVNGKISSSLSYTYVLVPRQAGKFTIGSITLEHAGKIYSTQPLAVSISGSGQAAPPALRQPAPSQDPRQSPGKPPPARGQSAPRAAQTGDAMFITTEVDRREVYVNEPVVLSFKYYTRIAPLSQPQYQAPETSGFWSEDLPPQREYTSVLNGQTYRITEIKTALFPTAAGTLTIGPARLQVHLQDFQRRGGDPFNDIFSRNFFSRGRQAELRSQPIKIQVKSLPSQGKPGDFSGTVGKWSLSAKLDRRAAKVGEAVTLEIRIFGEGNVKSVGKPNLPVLTGFKVYETVSSSEVQKKNDQVRGVKIYRTLLRPEVTGTLTVPPITYSYFNPDTRKYEKVQVPALNLKVLPGEIRAAVPLDPASATTGEGVKVVARDIRYLKTKLPLQRPARPLPAWLLISGFLLPPLAVLGIWGWQRHQDRLLADPRYARRRRADQSAWRALRQARRARLRGEGKKFYSLLAQALAGYLADQLGVSRSGITQREILSRLREKGADEGLTGNLNALFDECDFARFAPNEPPGTETEKHEQQAEALLTQLNRILTRRGKA